MANERASERLKRVLLRSILVVCFAKHLTEHLVRIEHTVSIENSGRKMDKNVAAGTRLENRSSR